MILIRCAPIRRTFILSLHRELNILRMDDKTIIKEVEVAMNYLDMAQEQLQPSQKECRKIGFSR